MYVCQLRIIFLIYDIHNLSKITFYAGTTSGSMIFFSVYAIFVIIFYIMLVKSGEWSYVTIFTLNRIDQISFASFAMFFSEPDRNKN